MEGSLEDMEVPFGALPQTEPEGLTDEELDELYHKSGGIINAFARAVIAADRARWGRPAIEPVPVSERLPGPEDCAPWPGEPDATPWAWAAKCVDGGWEWTQLSMWGMGMGSDTFARIIAGGGWTHWLPHHALPVPNTSLTNETPPPPPPCP